MIGLDDKSRVDDLTVLGNEHRDQYANGLISGQVNELPVEYRYGLCDEPDNSVVMPHYYAQLLYG